MGTVFLLTKRNLNIFFKDKMGVFFSLLSALILFVLYAVFLGNLQVENLQTTFPQATVSQVQSFVNAWVFAGITMITVITTSLAALNVFVEDAVSGRFKDFLVSPIKKTNLILGYMLASFVISLIMTTIVLVIGQTYILLQGEPTMNLQQVLQVGGYMLVSAAAFSASASFVVTFIKSNTAFSALSTIVGTILGFLAGAYIPVGTLQTNVVNVLNSLPFSQTAMLFRQPYTNNVAKQLVSTVPETGQTQALETLNQFYGITANVGSFVVTNSFVLTVLVVMFLVFVSLASWQIGKKIK